MATDFLSQMLMVIIVLSILLVLNFLLESVKETNLAQGILMFFDRFTSDTNVYGRKEHYPHYDSKHFYDPVSLYTLDDRKIKFIPANTYVNE